MFRFDIRTLTGSKKNIRIWFGTLYLIAANDISKVFIEFCQTQIFNNNIMFCGRCYTAWNIVACKPCEKFRNARFYRRSVAADFFGDKCTALLADFFCRVIISVKSVQNVK